MNYAQQIILSLLITTPLLAFATPQATQEEAIQDPVFARQQSFDSIETLTKKVSNELEGSAINWQQMNQLSTTLVAHGKVVETNFESSMAGGKAKEAIWDKPEKFEQLMLQMNQGFEMLYQAGIEQNLDKAEQGLEFAQDTCKACHRSYRSRW